MIRTIRIFALLLLLSSVMLAGPVSALAVDAGGTPSGGVDAGGTPATDTSSGGLTNPLNNINSLPDFMNAILDAIVQLGSIVLVFAIVYVGFKFVTAQGNEEEIKSARSALMWTVIGGLVLLGAKTVGLVISTTVKSL